MQVISVQSAVSNKLPEGRKVPLLSELAAARAPPSLQWAFRISPRRSGLKRMTTMIATATTAATSASA